MSSSSSLLDPAVAVTMVITSVRWSTVLVYASDVSGPTADRVAARGEGKKEHRRVAVAAVLLVHVDNDACAGCIRSTVWCDVMLEKAEYSENRIDCMLMEMSRASPSRDDSICCERASATW